MPFRRNLVGCLALVVLTSSFAMGNDVGGALAESVDYQIQASPVDAQIVSYANEALMDYAGLPPGAKKQLESSIRAIAELRRESLARLISSEPRQALLLSLSPFQRQGLPESVLELLEARVHTRGDLVRSITEDAQGDAPNDPQDDGVELQNGLPPSTTSWAVRIGQVTLEAFVHGIRRKHQTRFDTPLHGIVVDGAMAVSDSPLYQYDLLETTQLGFKPGQIVATSGGLPIPLPDFDAFFALRQELLEQILQFGPYPFPFDPYAWTTGPKQLLVIKAEFSDGTPTPYTDAEIAAAVGGANTFFSENSQGQTSFVTTVISTPLMLASTAADYARSGESWAHVMLRDDAWAAALAAGTDPDDYDRVLVLAPQVFDRPMARAAVGGKTVTVTGRKSALHVTVTHELGHTYRLIHSAFWLVAFGADPVGPGSYEEYGDAWDMMGGPAVDRTDTVPLSRHFNAFFKMRSGWLPGSAITDGTSGGDFRLYAHDSAGATGLRAIFIDAGDGTTYWLGMRRRFPWNASMSNGIEVRRVKTDPGFTYGPVELLDMDHGWTPGPPVGVTVFHSLAQFNVFEDTTNGVTIRVPIVTEDDMGRVFARVFITR